MYPNGVTATFTRDATSNISHITDATKTATLLNLAYGRNATEALTATTGTVVTTMKYDARGDRISASTPASPSTLTYNAADRLTATVKTTGTSGHTYDGAAAVARVV